MNKKRFSLTNPISHNPIPSWVDIIHDDKEHKHLGAEEIVELLNNQNRELDNRKQIIKTLTQEYKELKEENQKLRELVLFYLDVATGECSSHYHKHMEEMCKLIFCCSHQEAKEKYGRYKDEWDIREHYKELSGDGV